MEQENWQQVRDIFADAVRQKPEVRRHFLEQACDGDPELHREVESLLSSYDNADSFMESPAVVEVAGSFEAEIPQLQIGQTLGHYEIIRQIGKGGMGEVYLAHDKTLDRKVAVKVLFEKFTRDGSNVQRFVQEAKIASGLNHPNILVIHEIGATENARYIVSEYIEGETLREFLKEKSLKLSQILDFSIQIAGALTAAHEAHLIHRDIKPENIMVRPDGLIKILDFGLAKLLEQENRSFIDLEAKTKQQNITAKGAILGTANYMSPEQARGKDTDERTDIWSLGVVLYEMLSGKLPFEGKTINHTIVSILEKEPNRLENMPDELQRIVGKSLTKDVEMRYQTARDLLIDLKNLRRELDIQDGLERSHVPNSITPSNAATDQNEDKQTMALSGINSTQNSLSQDVSSAEYLLSQVWHHKTWTLTLFTLAVFLVTGIGLVIYKFSGNQATSVSFESAKFTRLTNSGNLTDKAAISPDGKWLVYAIRDGEQQSLWLKQVAIPDSNTQIVPPTTLQYFGLAFSPDGNYLYYTVFERAAASGTVYQVPVLGGTAKKLFTGIWGKVSFSPDGKQIAYFDFVEDEDRLMVANADGTEQRQLAARKGNEYLISGPQGPSWSPDGKTIATTVGTANHFSVATVSVATGEIDLFTSQKFDRTVSVTWLADGKSVLVLARETRSQPLQFWQISYPSGEARKISNDLNGYGEISLTADSSALATVQGVRTSNIWTAAINDPARATQVTSGNDYKNFPSWTPDGKIILSRNSGGNADLYILDPQGGSRKQLTSNAGENLESAVSPDGEFIVFGSTRAKTRTLWRMNRDGSNPVQLTKTAGSSPSFSPDGREIIYVSHANKSTIWKIGIDGGESVQLTDEHSISAEFSPDGKQFACFYRSDPKSDYKLAIIPSGGGLPIKSFPVQDARGLRWMPDGRSIAYIVNKGDIGNIWTQGVDGGTPKQMTNFTSDSITSFDFSRDGKQIAVARQTDTRDVVLISGIKK